MSKFRFYLKKVPTVLWVIIVMMVVFAIMSKRYLTLHNIINILQQGAVLLVIASAATCVIISGGLDLSLGGVMTISGITCVMALNAGMPVPIAMIIGTLTGAAAGAVNGVLISIAGMRPFIATLGMQGVLFGLSLAITDSVAIFTDNRAFVFLGDRVAKWIPMAAICCGIVFIAAVFIQNQTRFGRFVYAIGGNEEGAHLSGINVVFWKWMVYTYAGLLTGIGGVILSARLEVADPIVGMKWEFDAIAATILGGTSLRIGKGDIRGTIIGVLLITIVRNGLNVIRVPSIWQPALIGTIIILSIVFQVWIATREVKRA